MRKTRRQKGDASALRITEAERAKLFSWRGIPLPHRSSRLAASQTPLRQRQRLGASNSANGAVLVRLVRKRRGFCSWLQGIPSAVAAPFWVSLPLKSLALWRPSGVAGLRALALAAQPGEPGRAWACSLEPVVQWGAKFFSSSQPHPQVCLVHSTSILSADRSIRLDYGLYFAQIVTGNTTTLTATRV
ncbi:hypothetical protein B0T24DRAFT_142718 [Lasiosphaeria ovina]|uniref:Uncharacterized protein n=1 Tax=Lasiosphaeria ovina TaxID=92902 RepID=A0AAE0NCI4_9PEZI|nr:hypothetical protein B0T24DRAFT_142718 [Lasiosphaeria ovina]